MNPNRIGGKFVGTNLNATLRLIPSFRRKLSNDSLKAPVAATAACFNSRKRYSRHNRAPILRVATSTHPINRHAPANRGSLSLDARSQCIASANHFEMEARYLGCSSEGRPAGGKDSSGVETRFSTARN